MDTFENTLRSVPGRQEIEKAAQRIDSYIHHTPVCTSKGINSLAKTDIFFKCENFQKVGAFKFRGASNAVFGTPMELLHKGVATHSSGNHAQALALAAKMREIPAYIVMPNNAPRVKKKAVLSYGAEIIECQPTLASRESTLERVLEEKNAHFIHPYNDYRIIAGQATCAMELINEIEDLDIIISPVGGGGLLSGTALSAKYFSEKIKVFAAEPSGADDAYQSFMLDRIVPSENPKTIADGLLTSLGDKTFPIIKKFVEEIILVDDKEIIFAMRLIWERMKILVEPSAAVGLAAVLKNTEFSDKKIGIILSGGNVDLDHLPF